MASKLIIVLALALVACTYAAPATTPGNIETTTDQGEPVFLVEEIEIKEVPLVVAVVESTTPTVPETTSQTAHKLVKRSPLRGDNPSQDLLENLDNIQSDDGLSGLDGRRIKFLPTWVG